MKHHLPGKASAAGSLCRAVVRFCSRRLGVTALVVAALATPVKAVEADYDPNFGYWYNGGPYASTYAYANLLRARAEYERVVIEARLAWSREQLNLALAEQKLAHAAALRQQIATMQYELARIQREDAQMQRHIAEIQKLSLCVSNLYVGTATPYIINQCLNRFLQMYVPAQTVANLMLTPVEALPAATNFRALKPYAIVTDFPGGNLGQLIDFIGSQQMTLVRWSPAHARLLTMLNTLGELAMTQIAQMRQYLAGIRAGTLNVWTVPAVWGG